MHNCFLSQKPTWQFGIPHNRHLNVSYLRRVNADYSHSHHYLQCTVVYFILYDRDRSPVNAQHKFLTLNNANIRLNNKRKEQMNFEFLFIKLEK